MQAKQYFSALLICFIFISNQGYTQAIDTTKNVKIINADVLVGQLINDEMTRSMRGQVMMETKDVFIECDSSIHFLDRNLVKAFSNVHIVQQPCTHIFCDSLLFDVNKRNIELYGNVIMQDDKMELQCNNLTYNLNTRIGYYQNGGQLTQDASVLYSQKGTYYGKLKEVIFKDQVVLTNPQYTMNTDTLKYNLTKKIAYFRGPTSIVQQESSIYCERGYYDTKNNFAMFGKRTYLKDGAIELYADTMQYDKNKGIGKAYKNVLWKDHQNKINLRCFAGEYNEKTGRMIARRNALLAYVEKEDTLYVLADTIVSTLLDSVSKKRDFKAFHHAQIYRSDFQAIADSLYYSSIDSVFKMYKNPIVWNDSVQLMADTIYLNIKNEKPGLVRLKYNAMAAFKHPYESMYDQLKATFIDAVFVGDKISSMTATQQASSIYYGKDEKQAYLGVSESSADKMRFDFIDGTLDKIHYYDKPKSTFYAMQNANPARYIMQGFEWKEALRPKSAVAFIKLPRN